MDSGREDTSSRPLTFVDAILQKGLDSWPIFIAIILLVYITGMFIYDWRTSIEYSTDPAEYIRSSTNVLEYFNLYHGPGYSAFIWLLAKILPWIPRWNIARLVSTLSAVGCLLIVLLWGNQVLNRKGGGWLAAFGLILFSDFWISGTTALSDMLASFWFLSASYLFWRYLSSASHQPQTLFFSGLAAGIAYLTRYITGYTLFLPILFGLAVESFRKKTPRVFFLHSVIWFGGFLLASWPWLYRSYQLWQNPFYSHNHLIIAANLLGTDTSIPELSVPREQFSSLFSVIAYDPKLFITRWVRETLSVPLVLVDYYPLVGHLAIVGVVAVMVYYFRRRSAPSFPQMCMGLLFVIYCALVSLVHRHPRFFLPICPMITLFVADFILNIDHYLFSKRNEMHIFGKNVHTSVVSGALLGIIIVGGAVTGAPRAMERIQYVASGEPREYRALAACLNSISEEQDRILSTAPQIPVLAERYDILPHLILSPVTVDELPEALNKWEVDYFIVEGHITVLYLPHLLFFLDVYKPQLLLFVDAEVPEVPANLKPVCVSEQPRAFVYEVIRE